MNRASYVLATLTLVLAGCADTTMLHDSSSPQVVHLRIDSVCCAWPDTQGQQGLLPALEKDATIAERHARFAGKKPDNLLWMHTQIKQLRYALNPKLESDGPGTGFGMRQAAQKIVDEMRAASATSSASTNVKAHAKGIVSAAQHVGENTDKVVSISDDALAATAPGEVAALAAQMQMRLNRIITGWDANQDGRISSSAPEAGVAQIRQMLTIMMKGEGL